MADNNNDKKSLLDNIKYILSKEDKINDQLETGKGLERYANDLLLLMSLVKDYYKGNYRNIPYKTISAAVAGLLYIINPIDIIPDFIPFIGHIDDALVLRFCLRLMEKDLLKYKKWQAEQATTHDEDEKLDNNNDVKSKDDSKDKDVKKKG